MKRNTANATQKQGTEQMTTFIVDRVTKGNWTVTNTGGETVGEGFKSWTFAEMFARKAAIEVGGTVIRMSSKNPGEVVAHIKPRADVPAALKRENKVAVAPVETVPTFDSNDEVEDEVLTEDSLNELPTPALVAVYNAHGGNINGKFKGARKSLVTKILAAAS